MDELAGLLNGPRAHGAFLLRVAVEPPWGVRIRDEAPLTLVAMVRGDAWVLPESGEPVRLVAGDVVVIRGPEPYTMADDPDTAPQAVIHPDQRCTTPAGQPLTLITDLGTRTWGNNPDGRTKMIVGTYQLDGEIGGRLLATLPTLVVVRRQDWDTPLIPLLDNEVARDEPGQDAVLDRLLDLLLIAALRVWFARPDAEPPAWYQAGADPVVGRALRLLQNSPEHPWTVGLLASETGVSRAALARRFSDLVGEPPMTYLTGWRLTLAADLLREPDATLGAVARRVGYASPFALSTAFKRVRGVSPRQYRAAAG